MSTLRAAGPVRAGRAPALEPAPAGAPAADRIGCDASVPPRRQLLLLVAIVGIAALLRLPMLGTIPNGLFLDEASRGYDAYALLHTGADQYGVRWPLFAEGIDDYTPVLYTLMLMPSVAALGLTETAVRLPAALAGIATVGLTYLAVRVWLGGPAGLIAAALLAVSPWHILPSRTGTEWVLLPLVVTAGGWLLGRGRGHGPSLLGAGVVLGVGLYSYAFARLLVPMLAAGYALLYWRDLRSRWRWALAGLLVVALCALPIVQFGLTEAGQNRLRAVIPLDRYRGFALVPYALGNFTSYFDPRFLIVGTEPTYHHRLAGFGPLPIVLVPLAVAGVAVVVRRPNRAGWFWLGWLAAAPASAALHRESPSSALLLGAIPAWQAIAGLGAARLSSAIQSTRPGLSRLWWGIVSAGLAVTAVVVGQALYLEYPRYAARDWLYGNRDAIAFIEAHRAAYDGVLVSDRLATPHVLVLFYARIDPRAYQAAPIHVRQPAVRSRGDIGPYRFGRTPDLMERPGRYLVWVTAEEGRSQFPEKPPILTVRLPDGTPSHVLYEHERRPS